MTNTQFSKSDKEFVAACEAVKLPPTSRQASKWVNQKGKAFKVGRLIVMSERRKQDGGLLSTLLQR